MTRAIRIAGIALIAAGAGYAGRVYLGATGEPVWTASVGSPVRSIAFSPGALRLAVGSPQEDRADGVAPRVARRVGVGVELLDELRSAGKLKTASKETKPLTFHDPCQLVRRGGVVQQPRNLLSQVATDFREMSDPGILNWCCGGGGGISANDRAEELRLKAFKRKKAQLEELNVGTMVTACANCRTTLEEGLEHYNMNVTVVGLTELLAEHLEE